jgi:uncharacterized protein YcbK (DUF882 family)
MLVNLYPSDIGAIRTWFLATIQDILKTYKGSVTSWQRSPAHNHHVGGSPHSLHLLGLAVDVLFDSPQDKQAAIKLATTWGIHYLDEQTHVHFQALPPIQAGNAP